MSFSADPYHAPGITTTVKRSGILHVEDPGFVDQRLFFHRFYPDKSHWYLDTVTGLSQFDSNLQNPGWNFYYYDTGNVILVDLSVVSPPYRFAVTKSPAIVAALAGANSIWGKPHAVLGGPPVIYDAASMLLGYEPTGDVGTSHGLVGQTPSYSVPDLSWLPPAPTTPDTPYLPGLSPPSGSSQGNQLSPPKTTTPIAPVTTDTPYGTILLFAIAASGITYFAIKSL